MDIYGALLSEEFHSSLLSNSTRLLKLALTYAIQTIDYFPVEAVHYDTYIFHKNMWFSKVLLGKKYFTLMLGNLLSSVVIKFVCFPRANFYIWPKEGILETYWEKFSCLAHWWSFFIFFKGLLHFNNCFLKYLNKGFPLASPMSTKRWSGLLSPETKLCCLSQCCLIPLSNAWLFLLKGLRNQPNSIFFLI